MLKAFSFLFRPASQKLLGQRRNSLLRRLRREGVEAPTPRGFSKVASPAFSGLGNKTMGITLSQSVVMRSEQGLKSQPVTRSRCQQVPHQPSTQPYLISCHRRSGSTSNLSLYLNDINDINAFIYHFICWIAGLLYILACLST